MPKETFFNLSPQKRARIADLALEEFSDRTYNEASISRIVARANIAKGSFYQYFENKLDLFRWLVRGVVVQEKLTFLQTHPSPNSGDFFDELEHMFLMGMRFGLAHPRLSRIGERIMHASGDDPEYLALSTELRTQGHANIQMIIEQGQKAEQVRTDLDSALAADLILAMSQHGLSMAIMRRVGVDLYELCARPELAKDFDEGEQAELIKNVIDLFRRGLGTGAAPGHERVIDLDAVSTGYDEKEG